MVQSRGIVLTLALLGLMAACRARQGEELPIEREKDGPSRGSASELLPIESEEDLGEEANLKRELEQVNSRLETIDKQLADPKGLTTDEIKNLNQQRSDLMSLKALIEEKLNNLASPGAMTEQAVDDSSKAPSDTPAEGAPSTPPAPAAAPTATPPPPPAAVPQAATPQAYPSCGAVYWGRIFECGGKKCAKTDASYANFCLVAPGSRPGDPSPYPLCGPNYYGTVFSCAGKNCAKSDAQYVNICEIGPDSQSAGF